MENLLAPLKTVFREVNGHRMHAIDDGTGAPVVMLHGNPSWCYYYRNLALALRDSRRVLVPDHIGMGLSDKPGDDKYEYTLASRVRDLGKFLELSGVTENITLVVHDWGGMIGMAWAVCNPDKIAKLVVLNTGAFRLPASKKLPVQLKLARSPLGTLLIRGFNAFATGTAAMACTRNPMTPAVRAAYLAPYDSWANRIATLRFVQDIPLEPSDRAWSCVLAAEHALPVLKDKPMLIAWGEKDYVFDGHFLDEWITRFPSAQVKRFPDCSHYILEDAAAEVVPLIKDFILK